MQLHPPVVLEGRQAAGVPDVDELVLLGEVEPVEVRGQDDEGAVLLAQDERVAQALGAEGRRHHGRVLVERRPLTSVVAHREVQAVVAGQSVGGLGEVAHGESGRARRLGPRSRAREHQAQGAQRGGQRGEAGRA